MLMVTVAVAVSCAKDKEETHDEDNNAVPQASINPNYVMIDWDKASLLSSDNSNGTYQIRFDGSVPNIKPGSIVSIDQDTAVHHIFVKTVNVNGNTVNITSTVAYLTDIFSNTDFVLSTAAQRKSSKRGPVFYPVDAYQLDETGVYRPLNMKGARKDGTAFTHNLWQFDYNNNGQVLFSGNNFSIYMEKMNLDLSLDMEMYMNFGGRDVHEIVGNAIDRYRSRALRVEASLVGTFNTEQKIRCDIQGSCSYSPDYDIWRHNLFPPLSIKFLVYGVPVVIKLNSDLYRQVEVTASGEISAYTGFTDHAQGRLGLRWQQSEGISPVATFENTFEFTPPTVEGKGQVEAKAWVFPRIRLLLYEMVGPSFDFKPYLSTTVSGGFREQMLGQSNDYCAWSLDCNAGMDAACGLSFQFIGYEVENYSTPNRNVFDRTLYHSPKKVVHTSGRPQAGQSGTVSFAVYDHNYLFNQDVVTPLSQIVKFEANGQLSSEYGIAHDGIVNVDWTPSGNDILYAKLYDIDGNVLAYDTVHAEACDCNLTSGNWVDLGLPSGLRWATRNVGASSPTDYGNYYAWGEITPKSFYDLSTYSYCYYDEELNEYVYTKYNSSDGLTNLQPGDDAATNNYGGRTPTRDEWNELISYTTRQWVTLNGVSGMCLTGPNGNSIFLPAAGWYSGSVPLGVDGDGVYWSSTGSGSRAYCGAFTDVATNPMWYDRMDRGLGHPVRAVYSAK